VSHALLKFPVACDLAQSSLLIASGMLHAQHPPEPLMSVVVLRGHAAGLDAIREQSDLLEGVTTTVLDPETWAELLPDSIRGTWAVFGTSHVVVSGV